MRFLRPLLDLTKLERQGNPNICNRLNANNLIQDIKLYQKSWSHHLERMDRSPNPGDNWMLEDAEKMKR
jgi:hypothetical protein